MSWQDILGVEPHTESVTQNTHYAQKAARSPVSADFADSAHGVEPAVSNPVETPSAIQDGRQTAPIAKMTQNLTHQLNSADSADSAQRTTEAESRITPYELMRHVFNTGGRIFLADGRIMGRHISPASWPAVEENKPAIVWALQAIYELAPDITPDLIAAMWMYSFNPSVLSDEQNKWENVLFLAELARDHPTVIMRHCTEPPTYLSGYKKTSKNVPSDG